MKAKQWCPTLSVLGIASTKDFDFIIPEVRDSECRKILLRLSTAIRESCRSRRTTAEFASIHELEVRDRRWSWPRMWHVGYHQQWWWDTVLVLMRQRRLLVCFVLMACVDCKICLVELSLEPWDEAGKQERRKFSPQLLYDIRLSTTNCIKLATKHCDIPHVAVSWTLHDGLI